MCFFKEVADNKMNIFRRIGKTYAADEFFFFIVNTNDPFFKSQIDHQRLIKPMEDLVLIESRADQTGCFLQDIKAAQTFI